MITAAQIKRFAPSAKPAIVKAIVENWDDAERVGLNSPLRIAHFMARVAVETGGLRLLEESLTYSSAKRIRAIWPSRFKSDAAAQPYVRQPQKLAIKVYGGRMGNAPAPSTDGWDYRGGGMLQTTGRAGYARLGFEDAPEMLRQPEPAFLSALAEWQKRGCNAMADRDDVVAVCKAINGGTHGLTQQRAYLAMAKRVFTNRLGLFAADEPEDVEEDEDVRGERFYDDAEPDPVIPGSEDEDAVPVRSRPVTKATVQAAQRKICEMGYVAVGQIDGDLGGQTIGQITAFQHDRGIPETSRLDAMTLAEIDVAHAEGFRRPIAPARADASGQTVRNKVPAAKESWLARQWAKVTGWAAAGVGVVTGAADASPEARSVLSPIRNIISDIPPVLWAAAVGGVCLFIYWRTRRAGEDIVEDYQTGRRV